MKKSKSLLLLITLILFLVPSILFAQSRIYTESQYQKIWCDYNNGQIEVILKDGTRCDCVTKKNAIEFDFCNKWYEAVGQSLHYALQTGKKAGIVIIIEDDSDYKYVDRLSNVLEFFNLPIDLWLINAEEVAEYITIKGK